MNLRGLEIIPNDMQKNEINLSFCLYVITIKLHIIFMKDLVLKETLCNLPKIYLSILSPSPLKCIFKGHGGGGYINPHNSAGDFFTSKSNVIRKTIGIRLKD